MTSFILVNISIKFYHNHSKPSNERSSNNSLVYQGGPNRFFCCQ